MEIQYQLDKFYLPKTIHITASQDEDKNKLARISRRLKVHNPSISFAQLVSEHKFDDLSDDEYDKLFAVVSRLNLLFMDPETGKAARYLDIFSLTVRLLHEYMLNTHCEASRIL